MHSAFAPQSMSTALPLAVGMVGASAARRRPRMRLTRSVAPARSAPVLPALTKPSASPAHGEGRILLVLKGRRRIVADLDHLGRVGDLHALGELLAAALLQGLQDLFCFSGQDDVHAVLLLRHQRALDGRERGEIAAHGVDDDLHGVTLLSCHSARPRASRRSFQASARRAAHFSRACRP